MEDAVKDVEKEEKNKKKSKLNIIFKILIGIWIITIVLCVLYLINSFRLLNKYDVDKFKLDKYEIVTLNGVLKKNRELVYASEKQGIITLKYDIEGISLNNVYEYLEELSSEGYTIVDLEDLYMRVVHMQNDIQIEITIGSNHLVFEHKIGIDYDKEKNDENKDESKDNNENKTEDKNDESEKDEKKEESKEEKNNSNDENV